MKLHIAYIYAVTILFALNSCNAQTKKSVVDTTQKSVERDPWSPSDSLKYIALRDSAKLTHIKNQFYRNKAGKLFEKMYAPKNPIDLDAGIVTFFKITNQDVDPLTFEVVGGNSWFAHDKKHVYNYRGNDSGMFCITMEKADVKFFKLMPGDNGGIYGMDNKHLFEESDIIAHINPLHMQVITNKEGQLVKIISANYVYLSGYPKAVLIKDEIKYKKSLQGSVQ